MPPRDQHNLKLIYKVLISKSIPIQQKILNLISYKYQNLFRILHRDILKLYETTLRNKQDLQNSLNKFYNTASYRNFLYDTLQYISIVLVGFGSNWLFIHITDPTNLNLHPIVVHKESYGNIICFLSIVWTLCTITSKYEYEDIIKLPIPEQKYFAFKIKLRRGCRNFSLFWLGNSLGFFAYDYIFVTCH